MMNQNNYNVWIWQPLLATEAFWMKHLLWDYRVEFHQEGQKIEVAFQPIPTADMMASVQVVHDEPDHIASKREKPVKSLTPHLDPIPVPKWLTSIFENKYTILPSSSAWDKGTRPNLFI